MIGERVRLAREVSQLTQEQIAVAARISQGTVSDLEAGRIANPADEVVSGIAKATDFPLSFFYLGSLPDLPDGNYRKLKRGTQKVTTQVRAQVRQVVDVVQRAESQLDLPKVLIEPAESAVGDLDEIEAIAQDTRTALGLGRRDPIPNLTRAAERAGVVIVALPFEMKDHDGFSAWPDENIGGRPIIAIARGNPGDRDRATIGHEIGHLRLHTRRQNLEPDRAEKEAWRFAGALLLPEEAAKEALRPPLTLRVLMGVKATFGISIAMGAKRALDLRLIDHAHFVSLRKQLSARRWNRQEPVEVASEQPLLLPKILNLLAGPEGSISVRAERVSMRTITFSTLSAV